MGLFLGLSQLESCAAYHDFMPEINKLTDDLFQIQSAWSSFDKRNIVDTKTRLQFCVFVKLIDDDIRNSVAFQINDYSCSFFVVRFIVDISNAFDHFFIYQFTNSIRE